MLRLVTALVSLIVAGQSDFDALPGKLTAAIGSGAQTVEVTILPGQYFYREGHLAIRNVHRADLAVSFQAEGAVFIGDSSASDGRKHGTTSSGNIHYSTAPWYSQSTCRL